MIICEEHGHVSVYALAVTRHGRITHLHPFARHDTCDADKTLYCEEEEVHGEVMPREYKLQNVNDIVRQELVQMNTLQALLEHN